MCVLWRKTDEIEKIKRGDNLFGKLNERRISLIQINQNFSNIF